MKLTPTNVDKTFLKCLFKENEDTSLAVITEGIMMKVGFNPEHLKSEKENIVEMCNQLPNNFKVGFGGGYSFLNMCEDNTGDLWTGEHQTMEKLLCLGIAVKKMMILLPRDFWGIFPGSMPYVCVK